MTPPSPSPEVLTPEEVEAFARETEEATHGFGGALTEERWLKVQAIIQRIALRAAEVATEREKKRCIVAVEAAHDENDSSPDACFSYHCVGAIEGKP